MARPTALLAAFLALAGACKRRTDTAAPPAADAARPPDAAALAADYDPTVLVQKGAAPLEVFADEPRTAAWADPVEAALGAQMRKDLQHVVPDARGVGLSCRTLSCL